MLSQFMFMIYLVLLNIYHIGNANASATCLKTEYQIGEYCCPTCPAGTRVQKHCTINTGTSCKTCSELTYQDAPNGLTQCFPCTNCDPEQGFSIKEECRETRNAVCNVLDGYYCKTYSHDSSCNSAEKHTRCPTGQMPKVPGTKTNDTVCEDCKPGYFSPSGVNCTKWKTCLDGKLKYNGTSSKDVACNNASRHLLTSIPVTLLLVVGWLVKD